MSSSIEQLFSKLKEKSKKLQEEISLMENMNDILEMKKKLKMIQKEFNSGETETSSKEFNSGIITSELFEIYLEQVGKYLESTESKVHVIPHILRNILLVYFVHNKHKTVLWKKKTQTIIYIDPNREEDLRKFDQIIAKDTVDFFTKLDSTTKANITKPEFRDLRLGILNLNGRWFAIEVKDRPFHKLDIRYIAFENTTVIVKNKVLTVKVRYINNRGFADIVCFSMPCEKENGIYSNAMVSVPEVDVYYRKEIQRSSGTTVLNLRYKHDFSGFNNNYLFDREPKNCKRTAPSYIFVLDKPFDIQIFYKNEEILKVHVRK
ncbi:hypothetical protein AVEN_227445-1 [Araneus ventricosus]|uniref:Uncharacterized protein n=1 Tax=Araneus ventricosus TaxID=182803 RepID=A0A4Y2UCX3_ARAVE|nr:hypothetical protein AVEN_227445-1 [Araneus ventricosus]